jgi:general secretion pathway protein B
MSYILDALRKADAERERGNVPGIHAQPTFAGAPQSTQPIGARTWGLALAGAAVVLLAVIAALVWKMGGSGTAPVNVASGAVAPNVPPVPQNMPASATGSPGNAATPIPALITPPPPLAQLPKPAQEAAPVPRKVAKAPAATPPAVAQASGASTAKGALPGAPAASSSEPRLYTYAELPDDIRRQVPTMTVGGSVYSPVPANRFMFVNGQVLHEGDVIAPGVVLEQIRVKAAVLTVSGYRYLMNY